MAVGHFLVLTLMSSITGARELYKTGSLARGVAAGVAFAASFSLMHWYLRTHW